MADHDHMTGSLDARADKTVDPVCGMFVDPQKARGTADYAGKDYFFCSSGCAQKFRASPEQYLSATRPASELVRLSPIAPAQKPSQRPANAIL